MTVKMAVLAPMPRARAATATVVKTGALSQDTDGMMQIGNKSCPYTQHTGSSQTEFKKRVPRNGMELHKAGDLQRSSQI